MVRARKIKYDLQSCKELLNEIGGEEDPFVEHIREVRKSGQIKIGFSEDHFLRYSSDYLIYAAQLIEALPNRKEEIIAKFLNIFHLIRAEFDLFNILSYQARYMLETEGIEKAPFEIVKAFFETLARERRREIEINIYSRHIPIFAAHQHLASFLRDYYRTSIHYEPEGYYSPKFDSYCSYSHEDITVLALSGITECMTNAKLYRPLLLIPSYYSPKYVCKRFNKNLISKDVVLAFQKARQNIQDCIESTYYGKVLDGIVGGEIMDFVYDVVLTIPTGTSRVLQVCEDCEMIEIVYDEYKLSQHPVDQYRRSSRIRNKNRENFFHRKRRRNEHPFFGKQMKRKRKRR